MEIFSTKYHTKDKIKQLSPDVLSREIKRAEIITIVSAYYSVEFIETLLEKTNKTKRKNCLLTMVFNGFSGQRLYDQTRELNELNQKLKDLGFQKIAIYLNRDTTLFHSKLYFIKNDVGVAWFIGSANASKAAFSTNEDLLIKLNTKSKEIQQYIEKAIYESVSLDDIKLDETVASNIIGFFRTGSIYFKPYNQLSFTFSGFKLPPEIEERLKTANERPRHTNPGKAWGAYNLKLSLGLNGYDEDDEQLKRLGIKHISIETCYGYWVPNKYRSLLDVSIASKSHKTRTHLQEIFNLINSRGVVSLLEDYVSHINDVKIILKSNNIDYHIDENELTIKYKKFVERMIQKLSDPKKLDRLCLPLISAGMPEIWEDNTAYEDFSVSFYEYIASSLTGSIPRIVSSIMDYIEITPDSDSDEIKESFLSYFESDEAEWADEYWRK